MFRFFCFSCMILLLTVGSVGCSDNPQKAIKPFNIVGFWAVNGGHQFENGSTIYFRKDGIFFCVAKHNKLLDRILFGVKFIAFEGTWNIQEKEIKLVATKLCTGTPVALEVCGSIIDSEHIVTKDSKGKDENLIKLSSNSSLIKEMIEILYDWGIDLTN